MPTVRPFPSTRWEILILSSVMTKQPLARTPRTVSWLRSSSPPLPTLTTAVRHLCTKVLLLFARHFSNYICHTSHRTSMSRNGTKMKPSPPDKDPFRSPLLRWAPSVLKLYQSFGKVNVLPWTRLGPLGISLTSCHLQAPHSLILNLKTCLKRNSKFLSSTSDLSWQLDPAVQNDQRL